MRSLKLMLLSAAVSLVLVAGAHASPAETTKAAEALQQALGSTKILGTSEGPEVLQAFESAAIDNPALLSEMAVLLAVARPELVAEIKKSIRLLTPVDAESVIKTMEQASINPTVDQLAALAGLEGAAPAASSGGAVSNGNSDNVDLGWAGFGGGSKGSAD